MAWFRRSKGAITSGGGYPASIVYGQAWSQSVGPGGGYGWGGGPRTFVGGPPGPSRVEIGAPGDFVPGSPTWGPAADDLAFPHATRWPGYPAAWEPPFYATGGGYNGFGGGGAPLCGRVSTVYTCTDLISRTLSTMNLSVTQASSPQVAPPWTDNPEPEIYTSIVDAIKALVNSMLHRGEAILAPTARYADGMVARWVVLNPDVMRIEAVKGMPEYSINGVVIPRTELLHIKYQAWPGQVRGVGPLEACAANLVSSAALERWGTELAVNSGIPTAVLSSPARLTKVQTDDLKRSWADAAASRGILPVILTGGLTYTPLNLKPADVGLLDLRTFDEARIASCFGVPLWLVGLPMNEGLTYSTVQGTFDYFWRATLNPLAYNIASALSGWALPRGQWLHFESAGLTQPPLPERATAYKTLVEAGIIETDEARIWENLQPRGQQTQEILAQATDGSA